MRALILIPCTDRKRLKPDVDLRARSLPLGSASDVAKEWMMRVASVERKRLPSEVYCGRAYQEAAKAAYRLSGELAVISAGLGVVRENQNIPSYSLTVAPGNEDTIFDRILCRCATPEAWWSALKEAQEQNSGVDDVIRSKGSSIVLLALSANYARLIRNDLIKLSKEDAGHLRIFGAGIAEHVPEHLADSVMPYDERLNGADSPLPGTMSDFASRALHHFAGLFEEGTLSGASCEEDSRQLVNLMSTWRAPNIPLRERLTDEEVVHFILEHWEETAGRSGVSLRLLRDSGLACEQSRFRDLFRRAGGLRDEEERSAA